MSVAMLARARCIRAAPLPLPMPARSYSFECPSASPVTSMECMNRNKRRINPANHGARPCNSVGRKSRTMKAGGWNPLGLRPMQTRPPIKPHGMPVTEATATVRHQ